MINAIFIYWYLFNGGIDIFYGCGAIEKVIKQVI
jgi:hypothetical protein